MTYDQAGRAVAVAAFGGFMLWSGVYSFVALAVIPSYSAGWDFNMDGAFTFRDALRYLQHNLCAPVHLVLWILPRSLRAFFEVRDLQPVTEGTAMIGGLLWLCLLGGCLLASRKLTGLLYWAEERQQMRAARERGKARRAMREQEESGR